MNQMFSADPTLDAVANSMLKPLRQYLPPKTPAIPEPTVSVASMAERAIGIGRSRGGNSLGSFGVVSLKGIRLEALARFQLWARNPIQVERAISNLNMRLMADRENLRSQGFLRVALEITPPAESFPNPVGAWRKFADYRVLYEFDYQSSDGAQGLIARIPVRIDDGLNQSMTITDGMTRWDNTTAPAVVVRGTAAVSGMSLLSFVPGPLPTGPVTVTRTYDGAPGNPPAYATLAKFLAAISGSASHRHAKFTFPSFGGFRNAFKSVGGPITLGDWNKDGTADEYRPSILTIAPPVGLPTIRDRFEVNYDSGRKFDRIGVVYLRLT